jgi:hypothetical protein
LRGKSSISASIEVFKQSQEVLGHGFFRNLIEHGANLLTDMGL